MTREFRILHVCTGNIGRSPLAERIMTHHLKRLGDRSVRFQNSSAGTAGCVGLPMEAFSRVALEQRGIDASGFVARQLTPAFVEEADLILTATRRHRGAVATMVPAAVRRTFTLCEFGQLAEVAREAAPSPPPQSDLVADAITRVEIAGRLRGAANPEVAEAQALDIADPIGAPLSFYLDRAAEIDAACRQAVSLLIDSDGVGGPDG